MAVPKNHAQNNASWSELLTGDNLGLCIALIGGVGLHAINILISTTILPTVVADIGGLSLYAWNTTLFVIASIVSAVFTGFFRERLTTQLCYLLATAVFALGSALCMMAPSMVIVLLGRTLQGFGGGLLITLCYAMIMLLFEQRLWPRALALLSAMWGIATLLGPTLGGVFAETGHWRLAFALMLPLSLMYMLYVVRILPSKQLPQQDGSAIPFRQLGYLLLSILAIAIASLLDNPWYAGACVAVSVFALGLLVVAEKRLDHRLFPRYSFEYGSALNATLGLLFLFIIALSVEVYVPFFLQKLHHQSPLYAGYIAAFIAVGWTASELYSAKWQRVAAARAIFSGPVFLSLGMIGLLFFMPLLQTSPLVITGISLSLLLIGMGIGVGWPHLGAQIFRLCDDDEQSKAAAALPLLQMFATAFGAALAGFVVNSSGMTANTPEAIAYSARILFMVSVIAALMAFIYVMRAYRTAANS